MRDLDQLPSREVRLHLPRLPGRPHLVAAAYAASFYGSAADRDDHGEEGLSGQRGAPDLDILRPTVRNLAAAWRWQSPAAWTWPAMARAPLSSAADAVDEQVQIGRAHV